MPETTTMNVATENETIAEGTIKESALSALHLDENDPNFAFAENLLANLPSLSNGRKGAKELKVGTLSYDEFGAAIKAEASKNEQGIAGITLVENKHFDLRGCQLKSVVARLNKALCDTDIRTLAGVLDKDNLTITALAANSKLANGKRLPCAMIHVRYEDADLYAPVMDDADTMEGLES